MDADQLNSAPAASAQIPAQARQRRPTNAGSQPLNVNQLGEIPPVPHNEYPMDGMTQFCRIGPPSQRSSNASPARPSSRGSQSDCSAPTSMSSIEPAPASASHSPTKGMMPVEKEPASRRSHGFFQAHSPFTRRNKQIKESPQKEAMAQSANTTPTKPTGGSSYAQSSNRSTQRPGSSTGTGSRSSYANGAPLTLRGTHFDSGRQSVSPEPVDPRANFQLNVGNNFFDVASPDIKRKPARAQTAPEELDPIAQALAELKGVTKQASVRMSADRYHGLATPAPPGTPGVNAAQPNGAGPFYGGAGASSSTARAAQRGTPPPSYEQPVSRLGAPEPAFTSKAMQQTTQKYIEQKNNMFNSQASGTRPGYDHRGSAPNSASRPNTRGSGQGQQDAIARSASPVPRSTSPRPALYDDALYQKQSYQQPYQPQTYRATSPNPYAGRPKSNSYVKPQPSSTNSYGRYSSRNNSPQAEPPMPRAVSPQPMYRAQGRPGSSRGGSDMALQLAAAPQQQNSSMNGSYGRHGYPGGGSIGGGSMVSVGGSGSRPGSSYYGGNGSDLSYNSGVSSSNASRQRSHSGVEARQCTKDGRIILQYCE